VKNYFNEEEADNIEPDISLLFQSYLPATKKELLDAMPSQATVSQLVSRYFDSNNPTMRQSLLALVVIDLNYSQTSSIDPLFKKR
jgi:hypothetical protein